MDKITKKDITGVILAGGRARRMGGADKGLVLFNGKPLIEYVIDALEPQVGCLLINANRNHEIYRSYKFDVISDELEDYCGQLRFPFVPSLFFEPQPEGLSRPPHSRYQQQNHPAI